MSEPAALPSPVTALVEILLNELLEAAPPHARERLAGRAVAIVVEPPGVAFSLVGAADRLQVIGGVEEPVDARVSGSPLSLGAAMARDDRSGLQIEGDATALSDLQRALGEAEHDWAALFERVAGAGSAGPLQDLFRRATGGMRHAATRSAEDLADYARDEAGWLPPSGAFEAFSEDVARLRDDAARLEARLRRLESGKA